MRAHQSRAAAQLKGVFPVFLGSLGVFWSQAEFILAHVGTSLETFRPSCGETVIIWYGKFSSETFYFSHIISENISTWFTSLLFISMMINFLP